MSAVYICGPMSGYLELNFPAFRKATELFREFGHEVISPVEIGDDLCGNDPSTKSVVFLRADLYKLLSCKGIALLPFWQNSIGARCEVAVAISLGFEFYDASTGLAIPRPANVLIDRGYSD